MAIEQSIDIDEVRESSELCSESENDFLEIEWYEVRRQQFTRRTNKGIELLLKLKNRNEWSNADKLYSKGKPIAQILIKKTLCIWFLPRQIRESADFCFFVGNRHLPIFVDHVKSAFIVPYDGSLYEQLFARYSNSIQLIDHQLLSKDLLKSYVQSEKYEN